MAAVHVDVGDLKRAPPPPPPPLATPRLKGLLSDAIAAGQLDVIEDATSSHVIIHGDKLYEPGSAEIRPELVPVINRIATEINKIPGIVTVSVGAAAARPGSRA